MQYNGTYQGSVQGAMGYNPNAYDRYRGRPLGYYYGRPLEGQYIQTGNLYLGDYKKGAHSVASRIQIQLGSLSEFYKHLVKNYKNYLLVNRIYEVPNPKNDAIELAENVLSQAALSRIESNNSVVKYVRSPLGAIPTILNIPNTGAMNNFSIQDREQYKDLLKTTINYAIYKECGQGELYLAKRLKALEGKTNRFLGREIKEAKRVSNNSISARLQTKIKDFARRNELGQDPDVEYAKKLMTIDMAMQIVDYNKGDSLKAAIDRLVALPGECNCMNAVCFAMDIAPRYTEIEQFISRNAQPLSYKHDTGLRKDRSGNMRG